MDITSVIRMISDLNQPLSAPTLARASGLSSSHFSRLFKAFTGCSVNAYIKTMRLQQAKYLLETSEISIKEVRGRVGISDASHFARDFKKTFGFCPQQWRIHRIDRVPVAPPSAIPSVLATRRDTPEASREPSRGNL